MSEKYSTDDLVRWVEGIAPGFHECCPPFAIIARLRAADKLCEAANPIVGEISNFADNDLTEYQVIRFKDLVRLRKAIADYNGKEE